MVEKLCSGHIGSYGWSCTGYKMSPIDLDSQDPTDATRIQIQDM